MTVNVTHADDGSQREHLGLHPDVHGDHLAFWNGSEAPEDQTYNVIIDARHGRAADSATGQTGLAP